MKLITTLEACQILIGAQHYQRFRSMFLRMKDAPRPKKQGPGKLKWYSHSEVVEYGKNHNALRLMNNAFSEYRHELMQSKISRNTVTPQPDETLILKFLRGDFAPEYKRIVRKHIVRLAKDSDVKTVTVRVSIGDAEEA
jgi:hypothetical protein